MAKLYVNEQLIATSEAPGILAPQFANGEFIITYDHKPKKYYTVIIYDDNDIHTLLFNVRGDDLSTGDELVEFLPFQIRKFNYDVGVSIYLQPSVLGLPGDDFDMEEYVVDNQLQLLYVIEFTILQKYENRPNIYSTRTFNQKLKMYKSNMLN